MQYKTIALALLEQQTELHERLRKERRLKGALETCSRQLRESHLAWQERLSEQQPQSDPAQIASEAQELATQELISLLPSVEKAGVDLALSLDAAMASIRHPTSRD
jgi:hypothetical protein